MAAFALIVWLALCGVLAGLYRWLRRAGPATVAIHNDDSATVTGEAAETNTPEETGTEHTQASAATDTTGTASGNESVQAVEMQDKQLCQQRLPVAAAKARALLAEYYKSATLDIDDGMMEDGVEPTVANVQVAIVLLSCSDLRSEFQDQGFDSANDMWRVEHVFTKAASELESVSMESLFDSIPQVVQEQGRTYRVFAISSAGCGKTTLFTKIVPLHWAMKELWPGMFDLLVARELRYEDVRLAKGVRELLGLNALRMTEEQRQAVEDYVHDNPQRICLVLDGLDETRLSNCSQFVSDIIKGKALKGLRLIITSRPCGDVFNLTEDKQHDRRVELIGFRCDDVETYIRKVLNAEEAQELLKKVRDYPQVMSLMTTPVLAYEICKVFHLRKEVPMCVSDLFQMMILRLAERNSEGRSYRSWNDVPDHVQVPVLKLGKFAFQELLAQRLVFTEKELLNESILRDALEMGLLVACDRLSANHEKQYRFSHLTLQESLAALYVFFTGTMTSRKIVQLVESIGPDAGHVRTFWTLLAARLDSDCLETLVNSLMTREKCNDERLPRALVSEGNEAKFPLNLHSVLCERLHSSNHEQLANLLLSGIACTDGAQYVWSKMSLNKEPSNSAFLKTLLETWVAEVPVPNPTAFLFALSGVDMSTSRKCKDLLEQQSAKEKPRLSLPLMEAASPRRMLVFRCFAEYAHHHKGQVQPVPSISASLEHKMGEIVLRGPDNPLQGRTVGIVVRHHMPSLKKIRLRDFNPGSTCQVPDSLIEATAVSTLVVVDCKPLTLVCKLLNAWSACLTDLMIDHDAGDEDSELLSDALASCRHLERFAVRWSNLSLRALGFVAGSLPHMARLKSIHFQYVSVLSTPEALHVLLAGLATCGLLEMLEFYQCGLLPKSLLLIADSLTLHAWPCLSSVYLAGNDFSDVTDDQAAQFIQAINAHGGVRVVHLFGAEVPGGSSLREKSAYTHSVTVQG